MAELLRADLDLVAIGVLMWTKYGLFCFVLSLLLLLGLFSAITIIKLAKYVHTE